MSSEVFDVVYFEVVVTTAEVALATALCLDGSF
jgi:hypothetical protein